jgi:hypothetical protein
MLLNAQQILAASDRKTQTVPVPEWGADAEVLIGSMGALDKAELQDWVETLGRPKLSDSEPEAEELQSCDSPKPDEVKPTEEDESVPTREYSMKENVDVMVRWCALSILDPNTKQRAFTDDQVKALGSKSMAPLQRIYAAAVELNGESQQAHEAIEKNSGGTPGGSSGSD